MAVPRYGVVFGQFGIVLSNFWCGCVGSWRWGVLVVGSNQTSVGNIFNERKLVLGLVLVTICLSGSHKKFVFSKILIEGINGLWYGYIVYDEVKYCQIYIPILSNIAQYCPILPNMVQYCPVLSNIVLYCSILLK